MFLTSRVHLGNPGVAIFNVIDSQSQAMAAALCVKAASDRLVSFSWPFGHVEAIRG